MYTFYLAQVTCRPVKEAQQLNIPIFAMVDTNSDPRQVDYVIPSNDDASKSIDKVMTFVSDAIVEGLNERKATKDVPKDTQNTAATENEKPQPKAEEKVAATAEAPAASEKAAMETASQTKQEEE